MKTLVTGGAGYIGSNLVDRLMERGDDVCVIDNLTTGSIHNIAHHLGSTRFRLINDDIVDSQAMEAVVAECDVIYHLAAVVGVKHIVNDPLRTILTNVRGTENVLLLAYRYWKRTVIASTSEIYGKSNGGALSEDSDRTLGSTTINRWSYSASKAIDEHLVYAFHQKGLPVSIVRYFNSFGPRVNQDGYGSVIANFIRQALAGDPLTVHGDGRQTRCFTFVDDTVRGTMLAAERPEAVGEAFNIGRDAEITILELAHLIKRLTGSSSEIVTLPYLDYYGQSYEDTPRRRPDTRKARERLGFSADVTLEQGLERTIAWCREHYRIAPAQLEVESRAVVRDDAPSSLTGVDSLSVG
jgi:UDP-glucose 4-epimerase